MWCYYGAPLLAAWFASGMLQTPGRMLCDERRSTRHNPGGPAKLVGGYGTLISSREVDLEAFLLHRPKGVPVGTRERSALVPREEETKIYMLSMRTME